MWHNWITQNIVEHARDRQAVLHQEANRQRLLQQLNQRTDHFVLFRNAVLFTGNLLITCGTWLKQRAALEQRGGNAPTMTDRFSRVSR